jgi:signal transduction histidine kinase
MRQSEQAIEWGVCLVRWALLVVVFTLSALTPQGYAGVPAGQDLLPLVLPVLTVVGAYNLVITLMLTFGVYFQLFSPITLVLDTVAFGLVLLLSGGASSPFFFLPLLPILVAAIRFSTVAAFLMALLYSVLIVGHGLVVGQVAPFVPATGLESGLAARTYEWAADIILFFVAATVGVVLADAARGRASAGALSDEEASEVEQLKMVFEMAASLSATMNYQRVLDAILDISRLGFADLGVRVGESAAMVLLYDRDGFLAPATHRNLATAGDETRRIRGENGIVAEAILSDTALIGGSPAADPELKEFKSLVPFKSVMCVPLRAGFETFGAVLFASAKANVYTPRHIELLGIFCNQATIALQNASLYRSLQEERDKIVDKEEQARHKLARDLHDGPTQDVAAIAMRLNFARLLVERDPFRAKAELERLEDLAHKTVREIRSMLFTLRPIILETEGLVAALNQYADNLQQNEGLKVLVQAEKYRDCLDSEAQGVVFAILEEAINNARKHARASAVWVRLSQKRDLLVAEVVDDGVGFDVQSVESSYGSRGSLGLVNLKERAELLSGTLNIDSTLGEGTRITLLVPIE